MRLATSFQNFYRGKTGCLPVDRVVQLRPTASSPWIPESGCLPGAKTTKWGLIPGEHYISPLGLPISSMATGLINQGIFAKIGGY